MDNPVTQDNSELSTKHRTKTNKTAITNTNKPINTKKKETKNKYKKYNKTEKTNTQKSKNISNTDSIKKRRLNQVLVNGKHFLILIRRPSCYSHSQCW